jgi:hypothetical protein
MISAYPADCFSRLTFSGPAHFPKRLPDGLYGPHCRWPKGAQFMWDCARVDLRGAGIGRMPSELLRDYKRCYDKRE